MKYSEKLTKEAGKTPFVLKIEGKKSEKEIETSINYDGNNTELLFVYATTMKLIQDRMFMSNEQILELTEEIINNFN